MPIPLSASILTILGDLVVENDETVNLSMNTFVNVLAGPVVNCVYTIINDDNSTVSVTTATPVDTRGRSGRRRYRHFCVYLHNPSATARTVSYMVTGTATSVTDYVACPVHS